MASTSTEWRLRLLRGLYDLVQNQPWLKRLAVRMVMWFPGWGEQIMARVGTTPPTPSAGRARQPDPVATQRYRWGGYRALLQPRSPLPAEASDQQVYVDISGLVQRDARTGIQRVVRNLTRSLALADLPGWRVEPVYVRNGVFHYARHFVCTDWRLPVLDLADEPIAPRPGDVFFTADLALLPIAQMRAPLQQLRQQSVAVHFVLYDLIPVTHPEFYQGEVDPRFARWLEIVLEQADSILCDSRAVAEELRAYLQHRPPPRLDGGPVVGWFHLGADLPTWHRQPPDRSVANALGLADCGPETHLFLMVGTLEPRKGHAQVLEACELLWAQGADIALIIIGKVGWNLRPVVERLRQHPQRGRRLCWLEGASDAVLLEGYARASALVAASYAEGFGLPLIEAAHHDLPIIARDIPVFREVAGEHAYYFSAESAEALAAALRDWCRLHEAGVAPTSDGMRSLTWAESAQQVLRQILPDTP